MQFFERSKDGLFLWYCKDRVVQKKEFLYVHFSRRAVRLPKGHICSDNYLFLPPSRVKVLSAPMTEAERLKQMRKNHAAIHRFVVAKKAGYLDLQSG